MYCRFCGKEIPEDTMYCPSCGKDQYTETVEKSKNVSMTTIDKIISIIMFVMSAFSVLSPFLKLYHMNISGNDVYFSYTDIFNITTKIGEVNLWKYDNTLLICAFFYVCAMIVLLVGIVSFFKSKIIFFLKVSASASAMFSCMANILGLQLIRSLDAEINTQLWASITETAMPATYIWYALFVINFIVLSIYIIDATSKRL